ncbi:MAG: hypothetical protein MJZ93_04510 [Paludibacteraceae bacterium]|nr:hypothetical protein [Paludibacteraceae bacterium]
MKKLLFPTFIFLFLLSSCNENKTFRTADISGKDIDFHITRFDSIFWNIDTSDVCNEFIKLDSMYPEMAQIYIENVMLMGKLGNPMAQLEYNNFHNYPAVRTVFNTVQQEYYDINDIIQKLKPAILRMNVLLPQINTPEFYTHISFFNQNVIVGTGFISISLDNYMGEDYIYYDSIGIYSYLRQNMTRQKIPTDYMIALLTSEIPFNPSGNLLDDMTYYGRILYAAKCLFPEEDENIILGYTQAQLKWAEEHEKDIWDEMISSHIIYTTNIIEKNKFTHDGPFTQPFGQESPSRLGAFIGYQIVKNYMCNNQNITLVQLMQTTNGQEILNKSKYQ